MISRGSQRPQRFKNHYPPRALRALQAPREVHFNSANLTPDYAMLIRATHSCHRRLQGLVKGNLAKTPGQKEIRIINGEYLAGIAEAAEV